MISMKYGIAGLR